MKPTQKQLVAIKNLSEYLGEKPKAVKSLEAANGEIQRLIPLVREYDRQRNADYFSGPAPYDFCF